MRKIGVVVDNDLNNDVRVLREIRLLQKIGFEIAVLCFAFDNKDYQPIKGVEIIRIPISRSHKNKLYFFYHLLPGYKKLWIDNIASFISKVKPDVLHVHDLYMSLVAKKGIENSKMNIPFVLDLHENYPIAVQDYNWTKGFVRKLLAQPGKWENLEGQYLSYASKIIVLSDDFKNYYLNKYSFLKDSNLTVIPNVIDIENFAQSQKKLDSPLIKTLKESNATIFIYFGAIAERRGIFETLSAFDKVSRTYNTKLLIIGPVDNSDKERFNNTSDQLINEGRIIYIPWIDLSELLSYLEVADIGLAPFIKNAQHESGIANKIYQYMFAKLPIIASDCKPQMELLLKESAGLIFFKQRRVRTVHDRINQR